MKITIKADRGNGKTNTLIRIAKSYLAENKRVLFVLPSASHRDNMAKILKNYFRRPMDDFDEQGNLILHNGQETCKAFHVDCVLIDDSQMIKHKDIFYPCIHR